MKNLLYTLFFISLVNFSYGITRIIYSNSNCNSINTLEKFNLQECRIMSLGGQLFSVKIDICNSTNWKSFVYFNSINCTEPHDLISTGPSNRCFLSESNLYEKIICADIIHEPSSYAQNMMFLFLLFFLSFFLLLL